MPPILLNPRGSKKLVLPPVKLQKFGGPPIVLGKKRKTRTSTFKKHIEATLDIISAPLSQPITFITKGPVQAAAKVRQKRQQIAAGKGGAFGVIATTLGTTALLGTGVLAAAGPTAGGVVGGAVRGAVLKGVPAAAKGVGRFYAKKPITRTLGTFFAAGFLGQQAGREFLFKTLPTAAKGGGEALAKTIGGENISLGKTLIDALKTAGLIGGGLFLGKKAIDIVKGLKKPEVTLGTLPAVTELTGQGATIPLNQQAGSYGGVVAIPVTEEEEATTKKKVAVEGVSRAPVNKINVKPIINIAMAQ